MSTLYVAAVVSTLKSIRCPWSTLNGVAKPWSASLPGHTFQVLHGVPARQFSADDGVGGAAHGSAFDADAGASPTHSAMNVATATRGRIARMGQPTVEEGHYSRGRK